MRLLGRHRRAAMALAGAAVLAGGLALGLALSGRGAGAPATGSAGLVPAGALAYLSLSTDPEREADRRAARLLARFPSLTDARDRALASLTAIGPGVSYRRDVRPWLGPEAAIALLDTPDASSAPLALLSVADHELARAFLSRSATAPSRSTYAGVEVATYGSLATAFAGDYLAVGPAEAVQAAIATGAGGRSLAAAPAFRRATAGLPPDRVAAVFLSAEGARRVLAAQAGLLGAVGSVLVSDDLAAVALVARPAGDDLRVHVRRALARSPAVQPSPAFSPSLARAVPADAFAYLALAGLERRAPGLLDVVAGGAAPAVAAVLRRAARETAAAGVDLRSRLGPLVRGEVALWMRASRPRPTLTLVAAARDEQATRRALAEAQAPLARALAPSPAAARRVTGRRRVGEMEAYVLRLGPSAELLYGVRDGHLLVSTSAAGLRKGEGSLADSPLFRSAVGERRDRVTSLVFLDFGRLLAFAERSGLASTPAYRALRGELGLLRALSAATRSNPGRSTTELFIEIR